MTDTQRLALLRIVIAALAGIVLAVAIAAITSACTDPDPCGAEPAPLPVLYLPAIQRNAPAMAAESSPWTPVPTVTPEVQP